MELLQLDHFLHDHCHGHVFCLDWWQSYRWLAFAEPWNAACAHQKDVSSAWPTGIHIRVPWFELNRLTFPNNKCNVWTSSLNQIQDIPLPPDRGYCLCLPLLSSCWSSAFHLEYWGSAQGSHVPFWIASICSWYTTISQSPFRCPRMLCWFQHMFELGPSPSSWSESPT